MPYPIRCFEPDTIYFVTSRCVRAELLTRPSDEVNRVIGGVVAHALTKYAVELFAFAFMSNHFHMLVRTKQPELLSKFVAYVKANVAIRLNALLGRSGQFWQKRFDAAPVLDEPAVEDRLQYIFAQGTKEGLVDHARDWPGLTSIPELADGAERTFEWAPAPRHRRAPRECRASEAGAVDATRGRFYPLELAILPAWRSWPWEVRRQRAHELIGIAEARARELRGDRPALGIAAVLAQDPKSRPISSRNKPAPICHATDRELRATYRRGRRAFMNAFHEASKRFRAGAGSLVEVPLYCFPPGMPFHGDVARAVA
jgi:putative transposase